MFTDTHAHYDDSAFDEDRESLISSMTASGVDFIINPGCDIESSFKACIIAEKYDFMAFAAGIHPENLSDLKEDWIEVINEMLLHPKCAAVGEVGLDYYWDISQKELQKDVFRRQLMMASDADMPVIVHDREAHADSLNITGYFSVKGVFHCFSGSREMAEVLLKRGWYLGFDGPVTYKNARKTIEVLEACPLDRILIETDSPYLSPVPNRGKRNDSRNLLYIAQKIAEVKNESLEKIAEITSFNAKELFLKNL